MNFTISNYYRVTDENHSHYGRVGRLVKETKKVFSEVILELDFGTIIEVTESFTPDQLGEAFQLYELVYYKGNPYRIIQIDTRDADLSYKIAEDYSESSFRLWVGHNSLKHDPRELTQDEYNQFPVGTKVRITKEGTHSYGVGDIAKISDIKNYSKNMNQMFNTTYENGSFNDCGWLYPDEFEPVEEKEEKCEAPCEEKCEDVSRNYEVWAELHNGSKTCLVTDLISKEHALHRMSDVCYHITNELMFHVEHNNEFINTKYIMRVYIQRENCGTTGEELAEAVNKLVRNIHGTII